jgi:drug/metabolite transporter (DMT)-like permease
MRVGHEDFARNFENQKHTPIQPALDTTEDFSQKAEPLTGIALKVASVCVFVVMAACVKLAPDAGTGQIVFYRSFFAIFPIVTYLSVTRRLRGAFHTNNFRGHLERGLLGVSAMGAGFFALTRLPLPDAIALGYAMPLLVVLFSALFLHETVRLYRWSAVVIGLVGVLVISWPKLTVLNSQQGLTAGEAQGVLAALVAASIAACVMLLVRKLVQHERTATIVLYFSMISAVAGALTLPLGWPSLGWSQAAWLVLAGFTGGLGQILLTESYRYADPQVVAPFEYVSIIFGTIIGFTVFGDIPTQHTAIGSLIVIGAGIFIIWREHRLGLNRRGARKVMTPQG